MLFRDTHTVATDFKRCRTVTIGQLKLSITNFDNRTFADVFSSSSFARKSDFYCLVWYIDRETRLMWRIMDRACYIIAYNTSKHSVKFLISKLPSRQLEKYSVRIFFAWRGLPSDNFFALPTSTARENERFCAYGKQYC